MTAVLYKHFAADGELLYIGQTSNMRQRQRQPLTDATSKLAAFGAAMLHAHRDGMSDIDGATVEEQALKCGVLEARQATEPCGDSCACAEATHFPTECYFVPAGVRAVIASLADGITGQSDKSEATKS